MATGKDHAIRFVADLLHFVYQLVVQPGLEVETAKAQEGTAVVDRAAEERESAWQKQPSAPAL